MDFFNHNPVAKSDEKILALKRIVCGYDLQKKLFTKKSSDQISKSSVPGNVVFKLLEK